MGAEHGAGLFGFLDGAKIENLNVTAAIDLPANESTGAIAGIMTGGSIISNCRVSGSVSALECGGLVGRILVEGRIEDSINTAAVSGGKSAGGIVAKPYYTEEGKDIVLEDCTNSGAVEAADSSAAAGGIAAFAAADIENCENSGDVTSGGDTAGGIVGEQSHYGTITSCINTGDVTGREIVGGIVGWIRYMSSNAGSYGKKGTIQVLGNTNEGTVTSTGSSGEGGLYAAGGIVGNVYNAGTITGNVNKAPAISSANFAAGIATLQNMPGNLYENSYDFLVNNNVSSTAADNITGPCKHPFVYNNMGSAVGDDQIFGNTAGAAQIGDQIFATVQAAVDYAVNTAGPGDITIILLAPSAEVVKITQQAGKNLTVQGGADAPFTGKFEVDGLGNLDGSETLTFAGITFDGSGATEAHNFIYNVVNYGSHYSYPHNVTLQDCTVIGTGDYENAPVQLVHFDQFANLTLRRCTGTKLHSMIWTTAMTGESVIDGCTLTDSYHGFSLGTNANYTITDTKINVADEYGIRWDVNSNTDVALTIKNCEISAPIPLVVRNNATHPNTAELSGNILVSTDGQAPIIRESKTDNNNITITADRNYWGGEAPVIGDIDVAVSTYYADEAKTDLRSTGDAPIFAADVDAIIQDGKGIIRFITKVNELPDTPVTYGTYILPFSIFEQLGGMDDDELVGKVEYVYGEREIQNGQTYAADLVDVPLGRVGEKIMAQSFMTFDGQNAALCDFEPASVEEAAAE